MTQNTRTFVFALAATLLLPASYPERAQAENSRGIPGHIAITVGVCGASILATFAALVGAIRYRRISEARAAFTAAGGAASCGAATTNSIARMGILEDEGDSADSPNQAITPKHNPDARPASPEQVIAGISSAG